MKQILLFVGCLAILSSAYADMLGINIELSRSENGSTLVSMRAGYLTNYNRDNIAVKDAAKVLCDLKFDKDAKFAVIHSSNNVPGEDLIPILEAMSANHIGLWHLRIGEPVPTGMDPWNQINVSIAGQEGLSFERMDLPRVRCGFIPSTQNLTAGWDTPTTNSFFVMIDNPQPMPCTMTQDCSEWADCLRFEIKNKSGQVFSVKRRQISWAANPVVTWILPGGGLRVMAVDFTSGCWDGLPPTPFKPESVTMTAIFRYPGSIGEKVLATSKPTDVCWYSK